MVVGAGAAGLAVSACLLRRGVEHVVLDGESEIAAVWKRRYDRLHLHSPKQLSALPFARWPNAAPRYPSRDEVVAYLQEYARRHAGDVRLGTAVRSVARSTNGFIADAGMQRFEARCLVVASGSLRVPVRPSLAGLDSFRGPVLHSSGYRNAQPFAGLRTVVVGCGNSGAEIALDLAEHGVPTTMIVRSPVHVVPRDLLGVPTQAINLALSLLPVALQDTLAQAVTHLAVGDLRRWGIVRPRLGPNAMIARDGRIPWLDIGTLAMIKRGLVGVLPGIRQVQSSGVLLADGRHHECDAIVLATGYAPGISDWFPEAARSLDARGRPSRARPSSQVESLYFVGFRNPPTGALHAIAHEAPAVADAIARGRSPRGR